MKVLPFEGVTVLVAAAVAAPVTVVAGLVLPAASDSRYPFAAGEAAAYVITPVKATHGGLASAQFSPIVEYTGWVGGRNLAFQRGQRGEMNFAASIEGALLSAHSIQ